MNREATMSQTTLPLSSLPAITPTLGQAVQNAYAQFENRSLQSIVGWTLRTTITGWDSIVIVGGAEECFALIYQNDTDSSQWLLAFRGTASKDDLFKDLEAGTTAFIAADGSRPDVDVHVGFFGIYSGIGGTMRASMQTQLFAWLDGIGEPSTVHITGHSLGGALAELFTFDLATSRPSQSFQTIDWAAPRVGTRKWVAAYDGNPTTAATIRIVNTQDVIPDLPPTTPLYDYGQVGQEAAVSFGNQSHVLDPFTRVLIRHSMDNYLTVISHALQCPTTPWPFTFTDAIKPDITDIAVTPSLPDVDSRTALIAELRTARSGRLA